MTQRNTNNPINWSVFGLPPAENVDGDPNFWRLNIDEFFFQTKHQVIPLLAARQTLISVRHSILLHCFKFGKGLPTNESMKMGQMF